MYSLSLRHLLATAIALTSAQALAQNVPASAPSTKPAPVAKGFHFVANSSLSFGGDTIAIAQYTNGSDQRIKAGGLFEFGAGGIYEASDLPIAAQLTANYHVNDTNAKNGSLRFHRFPVEATVFYTGLEDWRFGVGARAVQSPRFTSKIKGYVSETLEFDDTVGGFAEVGYALSPRVWINVRYVTEKYKTTIYSQGSQHTPLSKPISVNGDHISIGASFQF